MKLIITETMRKFITLWGERGPAWGINRTVAQIFALLYITESPLNADDIRLTLNIARSNVSQSLHELKGWKLIKPVHILGERKEHYECLGDTNDMISAIIEERKRREIDPVLQTLIQVLKEAKKDKTPVAVQKKIAAMHNIFDRFSKMYDRIKLNPMTKLLKIFN